MLNFIFIPKYDIPEIPIIENRKPKLENNNAKCKYCKSKCDNQLCN